MKLYLNKIQHSKGSSIIELSSSELEDICGGELRDSVKLGIASIVMMSFSAVALSVGITKMCHAIERNGDEYLWPDTPEIYASTALTAIGAIVLMPSCGVLGATIQASKIEKLN